MNWFFSDPKPFSAENGLPDQVKTAIETIGSYLKDNSNHSEVFYYGQKNGSVSILPNHFYSPVPNVFDLPEGAFNKSSMPMIEKNFGKQIELLQDFKKYQPEYEAYPKTKIEPHRFYCDNNIFVGSDPRLLHCFIRHFKPNKVIEVGSGLSTLLTNEALLKNGKGSFIAIEPFPQDFLKEGQLESMEALVIKPVQEVDLKIFESLGENDILFIDSSHVLKLGSDVAFLYLEVIPRLKPGTLIHIHDIFFPYYYPKKWIFEAPNLWNESYLLQAVLQGNSSLEILFGSFMLWEHLREGDIKLENIDRGLLGGGSFWMRKR